MGSQKENHCIMADLGKVEKILMNLEAMPECNGCATIIRRGRRIIRRAMKSMAHKKKIEVNWDLVDKIIQIVARLITLLNLERLKGYFNICKCIVELLYGCSCKARQAIKNHQNRYWSKTERSCQRIEDSCSTAIYV